MSKLSLECIRDIAEAEIDPVVNEARRTRHALVQMLQRSTNTGRSFDLLIGRLYHPSTRSTDCVFSDL